MQTRDPPCSRRVPALPVNSPGTSSLLCKVGLIIILQGSCDGQGRPAQLVPRSLHFGDVQPFVFQGFASLLQSEEERTQLGRWPGHH